MITFGDAVYAGDIPYAYAALYDYTCTYPTSPAEAIRWDKAHTRWITFNGNPEASIIDWEPGTRDYQTPRLLTDWIYNREGEHAERPPWIYTSLDNAASAAEAAEGNDFMWWVATLDGVIRSRGELAELLSDHGVSYPHASPDLVAAQQIETIDGKYDRSVCFNGW